jgi:uncharacterized protein
MATWRTQDSVLCLVGGVLLGSVVSVRMALFGQVTGSSGIMGRAISPMKGDNGWIDESRTTAISFNLGMVFCGLICCSQFSPAFDAGVLRQAFDSWDDVPWGALIPAGFLTGFGTALGNGCTSGHGICGISSFRLRSLVATCTFMTTGIVTAIVANTRDYYDKLENTIPYDVAGFLFGIILILNLTIGVIGSTLKDDSTSESTLSWFKLIAEFMFGFSFSMGLVISNMTRCAATISFLDLRYWNPALAFVMAGAILVAVLSFTKSFQGKPILANEFKLSKLTELDWKLISGAACFGIGWGLMGACPAPAMTNLLSSRAMPRSVAYLGCLILGMYGNVGLQQYLDNKKDDKKVKGNEKEAQNDMILGKAVVVEN